MRFLHLSDLHFNPEHDGVSSRELRESLISYLIDNDIKADDLIITGDFRHAKLQKVEQKNVDEVVAFIFKIAKAIGVSSSTHIHIVPGNHDLERSNDHLRIRQIKEQYDSCSGTINNDDLSFLKSQFSYFDMVCNSLYGPSNYWGNAELHTYRIIDDTAFLYLNTSITHCSNEDRGCLIIGNDCLDRLLREINQLCPSLPIIILAHHTPDCFEKHEKEAVERILSKYPNIMFYLCGDSHEVWLRKVNNHVELTMGCIKQENNTEVAFLYGNTETSTYTVHHWVRAWEPYQYFNKKLIDLIPSHPFILAPDAIKNEQIRMGNDSLLPWLRNTPALSALFPKLFVEPEYISERLRTNYYTHNAILQECKETNLIITGEAGAGKTTLLRQFFLYNNDTRILYLHAKALLEPFHELRPYQKFVRNLLFYGIGDESKFLVLLDGMDEAYTDKPDKLEQLIQSIDTLKYTHVWFGWRSEHLVQHETERLRQITRDTISLKAWNPKRARKFAKKYADVVQQPNILSDFDSLVLNNDTIKGFTESPFQLTLLVCLLENKQADTAVEAFFNRKEQTLYSLYDTFFQCWISKEKERKTSCLDKEIIKKALWDISSNLYYSSSYEVSFDDTAITGLLTFSSIGPGHRANGFFHRSFCAFFLADKIYDAVKMGDCSLINALMIPLRNDVTDFVRSAISGSDNSQIQIIQTNLFNLYHQIDNLQKRILSTNARRLLKTTSKEKIFVLKNELIYLVTRIPDPTNTIPGFLQSIYTKNKDPYILLDIAYAATLTGPRKIALDYAKSLKPGPASLINRSWTIAYFGDVIANPHTYQDIEKAPWNKSREARLKRFQQSTMKALRFRILDFPLMYCFYDDRNWIDVNEKDYHIIKNTNIDNDIFSEEEKEFLKQAKNQLLQGFQDHMGGKV